MADGDFPILVSKDNTANSTSNPISVEISDGTDTLGVNADGSLNVTLSGGAVDDAAFTPGTDTVTVLGGFADETAPDSVDEGDQGALRMTLDRKLLTRVVGATDANRLDIDGSGHAQIDIAALSLTALPVSSDSSANSETNPIYVQVTENALSNETYDYQTDAAVAGGASANHDVTAAGGVMLVHQYWGSASGAMKTELIYDPAGVPATIWVGFHNGTKGGAIHEFCPKKPYEVPDTDVLRATRTNREGSAQDLYSTFLTTQL